MFNLDQQGSYNSDSIVAEDRRTNGNNDNLDLRSSEGESGRGQGYQNSQEDFGTGWVKTNHPPQGQGCAKEKPKTLETWYRTHEADKTVE